MTVYLKYLSFESQGQKSKLSTRKVHFYLKHKTFNFLLIE